MNSSEAVRLYKLVLNYDSMNVSIPTISLIITIAYMLLAGHQLPFGVQLLGRSSKVSTKTLVPLIARLRLPGSPMVHHPDDLLIVRDSEVEVTSLFRETL